MIIEKYFLINHLKKKSEQVKRISTSKYSIDLVPVNITKFDKMTDDEFNKSMEGDINFGTTLV